MLRGKIIKGGHARRAVESYIIIIDGMAKMHLFV